MTSKKTCDARPRWLLAMVRLTRIKLAKAAVKLLLPPDLWIGNHKGAYTCKWAVHLGKLDNRGVLQGVEDRKA
jgi:hypothetical protein